MSSGGAFWAAGNQAVKSANLPTPCITEAPPQGNPDPVTQQKKGLVLKSKTNSTPAHNFVNGNGVTHGKPNGKKTVWADEEDDDEVFTHEFLTEQNSPPIVSLQTKIAVQGERIKELEATVVARSLRIAELEGKIQEKDCHIEILEGDIYERDEQIEQLRRDNHEQYVKFQDLHLEVCAKASLIGELETELKQPTTTQEPKQVSVPHYPPPPKVDDAEGTQETKAEIETPTTPTVAPDTSKVAVSPESQEPPE